MEHDSTVPMKKCTKCGEEKPATTEYFGARGGGRDGLRWVCKLCDGVYAAEYYQQNKEKFAEQNSRYYQQNKDRIRRYRQQNKEQITEQKRQYRQENRGVFRANRQRRRARKLALPNTWTAQDWQRCLAYWQDKCAVCGYPLKDVFDSVEPHADHWIPLNYKSADNPGTIPANMICLCNSCNHSKRDKLPDVWLTERYGEKKATAILKRIETYFEWVRQHEHAE